MKKSMKNLIILGLIFVSFEVSAKCHFKMMCSELVFETEQGGTIIHRTNKETYEIINAICLYGGHIVKEYKQMSVLGYNEITADQRVEEFVDFECNQDSQDE